MHYSTAWTKVSKIYIIIWKKSTRWDQTIRGRRTFGNLKCWNQKVSTVQACGLLNQILTIFFNADHWILKCVHCVPINDRWLTPEWRTSLRWPSREQHAPGNQGRRRKNKIKASSSGRSNMTASILRAAEQISTTATGRLNNDGFRGRLHLWLNDTKAINLYSFGAFSSALWCH